MPWSFLFQKNGKIKSSSPYKSLKTAPTTKLLWLYLISALKDEAFDTGRTVYHIHDGILYIRVIKLTLGPGQI